ncbi:FAD dependent oxidoreductase-domain-containing protein [Pavlovales sp. CCMP2436]|nr:FAD dependent oxidoreductase-domain-containing protein [Pavlovales sp. CCMP2436]
MPVAEAASLKKRYSIIDEADLDGDMVAVPKWTPPSRKEMKETMKTQEFDVLVIGGGATGTGVAMDASTRGLKTALVEREDFASGTSSRSTKLIHGGIRYLAQAFQSKIPPNTLLDVFRHLRYNHEYMMIVSNDLAERAYMIESAPFMTHPIPMMVPLFKWWEVPMMYMTGKLYDLIAGNRRAVPPSHFIPRAEALFQFPSMKTKDAEGNNLKGCLVIYDGQQNDTRMNLCIALTAIQAGTQVQNHTEVLGLLTEGTFGQPDYKVCGAKVRDMMTGEAYDVRAKSVINACGVFSDKVRKMADPSCKEIMVPAPGTHLILPDYCSPAETGMVWFTKDGRILYLLPWEGSTIAGTTDTVGEITFEPRATLAEIDFILGECNRMLRDPIDYSTVRAAWSGIRPLVRDPKADPSDTKKLSRDHVVDIVAGNLVTIAGGKWTTYRKMAEDAVDKCIAVHPELKAAVQSKCITSTMQLVGADRGGEICDQNFDRVTITLREEFGLDKDTANHLRGNYGTRALQLALMARTEPQFTTKTNGKVFYKRLHPKYPQLEAEVAFACRARRFLETMYLPEGVGAAAELVKRGAPAKIIKQLSAVPSAAPTV